MNHLQLPLPVFIRLPRWAPPPLPVTTLLNLPASRPAKLESFCRPSPRVVRLGAPALTTAAVLGLSTFAFQSFSFSLFTIRRAWDAVNIAFSPGGLADDAAVGLRLRCARNAVFEAFEDPAWPTDARLSADFILIASLRSPLHFSSESEAEL